MDPSLTMFGMNALTGLAQGSAQRSATRAGNTVRESEVYASNLMRKSGNELSKARASLARYNQVEDNKRIADDTGSAMEANSINYLRARDGAVEDSLDEQIAFAEQAGAQAAAGAASGLTGGVVDVVSGTTALRRSRMVARQERADEQFAYDAAQQQRNIFLSGMSAMDQSTIMADIDYGIDTFAANPTQGNFLTDILGGQTKETLQGALKATDSLKGFFSTPAPSYIDGIEID